MQQRVEIELIPRQQFRLYLLRTQRWACMVVHRRGGKTFCCIQDLLNKSLSHKRRNPPPRYAYVAPTKDQAKDIAWGYLTRFCSPMPGAKLNESALSVTLPTGALIRLYSGDNYDRMRGLYLDGAVIDEYGQIDPLAWHEVIRPCLGDYQGWATFIGTPRGKNHFWETWANAVSDPEWFSLMLKASESGIIAPAELKSIRAGMPDYLFRQEFECDFTAPMPGAVYAKAIEEARSQGRICPMPIDGSNLVDTFWDLGSPINTVVWYAQVVGREIRVIDCDRGDKGTLVERVAMMKQKGYNFGRHYFPHDCTQTERTGATLMNEAQKLLSHCVAVPKTHDVWYGINHTLEMFSALSFRSPHCDEALSVLALYRTRREGEGALSRDEPVHDFASHTADALRTMGEAHRAGLLAFKHTNAEVRKDWYAPGGVMRKRMGCRPMRVS